jgi:multidrug efflux pump subunit AcrB
VDPKKLRRYNISPDQVVEAVAKNNADARWQSAVDSINVCNHGKFSRRKVSEFADIPSVTTDLHHIHS